MRCRSCERENRERSRFCVGCGAPFPSACPACGSEGEPGDRFCGDCGRALPGPWQQGRTTDSEREGHHGPPGAELRQITVMFCDLVDSTDHLHQSDLEDWREFVRCYHELCTRECERFGGHVAQYLGDGVLVYFGLPVASERDAEGAVRAGLAIVGGMAALNAESNATRRSPLQVRIGLHTGTVVADSDTQGDAPPAMGETVHLAARLQALADPDSIVLSETVRSLVHQLFRTEDLGLHEIKGFSEPVALHRALGERPPTLRFAAASVRELPAMVGRDEEMASLCACWERVSESTGQVVCVSGEAGFGKTRLVEALRDHLSGEPHRWVVGSCSPFRAHSPLSPIVELLREELGWSTGQTPEQRAAKLEASLDPDDAGTRSVLGRLLSLPGSPEGEGLASSPEERRRQTLAALSTWLRGLSRESPVVIVIEDLQWADPSTLELLGDVVHWTAEGRVLMVLTQRPEFEAPWQGQTHVTEIALARLTQAQSVRLIEQWSGETRIERARLRRLLRLSDGVPLFVEEMARVVAKSGADGSEVAIPATLQDLLEARLEGLGPAREVAQYGAIIGGRFSAALLEAISPFGKERIQRDLEVLVHAGIVHQDGPPEQGLYTFKSWILQEAAYGSVLKRDRRILHARVAETLEAHHPEWIAESPELLAHHYSEAHRHESAMPHWEQALRVAFGNFAIEEAAAHAQAALECLQHLDESPERELRLLLKRAGALVASRGFGDTALRAPLRRALALARESETPGQLAGTLVFLCAHHMQRGDHARTRDLAEELLRKSEELGDQRMQTSALFLLSAALLWCGDFEGSLQRSSEAIELYDPAHFRYLQAFATDTGVTVRGVHALALWVLGRPGEAIRQSELGVALGRSREPELHHYSLGWALNFQLQLALERREPKEALEISRELVDLAVEHHFDRLVAWGTSLGACAKIELGDVEEGVRDLEASLAEYDDAEAGLWHSYCRGPMARGYGALGRYDEAFELLERSKVHAAETGERFYEADLHRIEAELILARDPGALDEAEHAYERALELSRKTGGVAWELRALVGLAGVRSRRGSGAATLGELRSLCERVGWDAPSRDLREARELLAEST